MTSPKRALELIARGRAIALNEWTIQMLPEFAAASAESEDARSRPHSPYLFEVVAPFHDFSAGHQSFLPYPQKDQETRWITDRTGAHRLRRAA
jgi:hypothetical protein